MTDALQEQRSPEESGHRAADQFEKHRRYLTGLAYRMLGSLTEAEDAVQEAYLRWQEQTGRGSSRRERSWLLAPMQK